jgi:hypothetical protein
MTTQYLITKRETCPVCEGDQYLANPDWQRINRENNEWMEARGITTFTDEALADWNDRIKVCWPYGDPPPEAELCHECEGQGTVETQVDLAEALAALGVSLHPPDWEEQQDRWERLQTQ